MKKPFVAAKRLEDIAKEFGTPFHLYDEKGIRENVRALHEAFSWNPGFKEYFAIKATPNPSLIRILQEENCGVDCSSFTELIMADRLGFKGDDIMFSSNVTPAQDFRLADKLDAIINLDDYSHIEFLKNEIGSLPETVSCRFNPGGLFQVSNDIMDKPGDAKYGMTREQLAKAFVEMQDLGVKHFGIHAFLVSNSVANEYYPKLARLLFELARDLKEETGAHISFINLSGGIGIPYRPEDQAADIYEIGRNVEAAYNDVLLPAGMDDVAIYTELGRFVTGPYGALVSRVLHKKDIYKEYVGLDACAADLMRPAMYGAYHHLSVVGKENEKATTLYDVTGGLCENNDKFAIDRTLPEVEVGDLIYIHDTGAHGYAMGYNYNGKLRSQELLLAEDGSVTRIRRAETPQDYFATINEDGLFDQLDEYEV